MKAWINSSVLPAIALQARQRAALWLKQNLLPYRLLDGIEYTRELQYSSKHQTYHLPYHYGFIGI